jgi:predicted phosphate transport protein (TIGR00153 family)
MFSNVMPKRSAYFDLLAAHTDRLVAGANATLRLITGLGQPNASTEALIDEVHQNEHSADKIKADLIRLLYESFTTPINRDQLHTLALDLDRVLDELQHVANAVGSYRIDDATAEARAMASFCADACMRLNRAVVALADRGRGKETVDLCQEIERIESKADKLRQKAVRKLFENEGDDDAVWRAIKMLELYSLLETVIDSCKRAAKTIEEILIENA